MCVYIYTHTPVSPGRAETDFIIRIKLAYAFCQSTENCSSIDNLRRISIAKCEEEVGVCLCLTPTSIRIYSLPFALPGKLISLDWITQIESGWDLGLFAAMPQCLHVDTPLLQLQNTKKLYGTKNNCGHAQLGQILDPKDTKRQKNKKNKKTNCHF